MGLRDDLRRARSAAASAVSGVVGDATRVFESWAEAREDERRWSDIDDRIAKATKDAVAELDGDEHKPRSDPKALLYDPFDMMSAHGYRERPSSFTYQSMEMVGRGVPVVADVIKVRTTQVSAFLKLPEDRHSPGLKVRLRDWRNTTASKAAEREAAMLEQVVLNTGFLNPARPQDGISLREFGAKTIADSLIYDQVNFEIVPDRKGRPSYLRVVDPSTIRLLDPHGRKPDDPYAVQVIDGSIVADFTKDELAFCVRNPRSGIRSYGYGLSELETLVREVTGFLWAMDYNRKFFTQGSATKGILNFKGTIPDKHLKAFRRQWYAMVAGVANAWRTPITNAEELQWINMQLTNRDMEYNAWMDFLIKIVCARYQIAPEEVNFQYGNTGQSQSLNSGAPVEEKLQQSKDLGLRPLVHWFFEILNRHLVQRLNPDFEVVPVGLDEKGFEAETTLLGQQQEKFLTVDEARERVELPPLGEEKGGDAILNPVWLQYVQGQQGMGDEGEEGMDPDAEDFPPPDTSDPDAQGAQPFTIDDFDDDADYGVDNDDDAAIKSERDRAHYTVQLQ